MRTITCEQNNAMYGHLKIVVRFHGHLIFMKFNNNPQKNQMIANLRNKGAIITEGNGWLRINIFGDHEEVRLNGLVFNPKEKTEEELEQILFDFYYTKYLDAKFIVREVK